MVKVKFMYNGIKVDGELYRAHYAKGALVNFPAGTITIYAKEYGGFPKVDGLNVENDSDTMTDYFEKDRIRVTPTNKFYKEVMEAVAKQEDHVQKRHEKKYGKSA